MNKYFFLLFLFLINFLSYSDDFYFLNKYSESIILNVPFYENGSDRIKTMEYILKPGDLYQSVHGHNGFVHKNYGLMPNISSNVVQYQDSHVPYLFSKVEREREFNLFQEGSVSTNMPKWWIDKNREDYKNRKDFVKMQIDNLSEFKNKRKDFEDYNKEYKSLVETASIPINQLSDPLADPDQDGLNNREELRCGSNPLIKDSVVFTPHFLEIKPDGNSIITGRFDAINLTNTNTSHLVNFYSTNIKNYNPKIVCDEIKLKRFNYYEYFILNLKPKQKISFLILFEKEFIPYKYADFSLSLCTTEYDCINNLYLYFSQENCRTLDRPILKTPMNGSCYTSMKDVIFSWSGENEINEKDDFGELLYKPQFFALNTSKRNNYNFLLSSHESRAGTSLKIPKNNLSIPPNIYIWRVIKQSNVSNPVASEWNWFSLGEEIKFDREASSERDYHEHGSGNYTIIETRLGVPFSSVTTYAGNFSSQMPKGVKLDVNEAGKTVIHGPCEEVGIFTNVFLITNPNADRKQETFYFVVRNDRNDVLSRSAYSIDKKIIIHDLTVNVSFAYREKGFYNDFSKAKDLEWDSASKKQFLLPLPDGLEVKKSDDDILISGTPLKEGMYTNVFVVENSKSRVEEHHLFRIRNIKEPGEFKIQPEKRTNFFLDFKNNRIVHYCYLNMDIEFPLIYDFGRIDHSHYLEVLTNCSFRVLGNLPSGLELGKVHFPPDPEADHKTYKGPRIPLDAIVGKPSQVGKFTNEVITIYHGNAITNRHIYSIKP